MRELLGLCSVGAVNLAIWCPLTPRLIQFHLIIHNKYRETKNKLTDAVDKCTGVRNKWNGAFQWCRGLAHKHDCLTINRLSLKMMLRLLVIKH